MKYSNISLGNDVQIDPTSSFNNVTLGDNIKIAKNCTFFGGPENVLEIGHHSYMGMYSIVIGYTAKISIGAHVSIAQNVTIMSDSGPNASEAMQRVFPIENSPVIIGDHSWIGTGAVIMPGVTLGKFCIVAANSYVNKSFPDFSIVGGSPAKVIRKFSDEEITRMLND